MLEWKMLRVRGEKSLFLEEMSLNRYWVTLT